MFSTSFLIGASLRGERERESCESSLSPSPFLCLPEAMGGRQKSTAMLSGSRKAPWRWKFSLSLSLSLSRERERERERENFHRQGAFRDPESMAVLFCLPPIASGRQRKGEGERELSQLSLSLSPLKEAPIKKEVENKSQEHRMNLSGS